MLRQLSRNFDSAVLALNPTAGSRDRRPVVDAFIGRLNAAGIEVATVTSLDEAVARSEELHAAGRLRALIAAGGDGTANELVNRTSPGVPLALLPLGTENLLAKHLGLTATPTSAAEAIVEGCVARLDAGLANSRVFLLHVGIGFDAHVVRRLTERRHGHIRHWSYVKPIWHAIRSYQYPELRVYCGEEASPAVVRWAFVFNIPAYCRGLTFTPAAIATDGQLDVCTFRRGSLWHGLRYLRHVMFGSHHDHVDCSVTRTARLRVECDSEAWYQVDGDPIGPLPVEIRVLPERLNLVVPQTWARQAGLTLADAAINGRAADGMAKTAFAKEGT